MTTFRNIRIKAMALLALALLASGSVAAAEPAPAVTFKIIDGRALSVAQLRGRPLLVVFWATTCSTCLKEMPQLIELYRELHPRGLEIIGVAMPFDPPNRVLEVARQRQVPYPVALDIQAEAAAAFGNVWATPTSFLIAPDGRIVQRKLGPWNMQSLRDRIQELL
ncbi:MAG: TlpA family protein disulfide reductase [Pseudomonadota bacterium]|nr:TlpA family protein disulfide reductase [Pseudomonadota bacterium]